MESLDAYMPIDRRYALARGEALPNRANGAILFADISGFVPLTKTLDQEFGPQRGAEELTRQLNRVFSALIDLVHRYRGSVIGFSGDAITCWFNEKDEGGRTARQTGEDESFSSPISPLSSFFSASQMAVRASPANLTTSPPCAVMRSIN